MKLVLDASAATSWLLEDERDDLAREMAAAVLTYGAVAPQLLISELHSVMLLAIRSKRATLAQVSDALAAVARLPLRFETDGIELASTRVIQTAESCSISASDATYVVLAQTQGAKLLTRDRKMIAAAEALGLLWEAGADRAMPAME